MGPLGAEASTAFKRFHQEVALKRRAMEKPWRSFGRLCGKATFRAMATLGFMNGSRYNGSHKLHSGNDQFWAKLYSVKAKAPTCLRRQLNTVKARWKFARAERTWYPGSPCQQRLAQWPQASEMKSARCSNTGAGNLRLPSLL
jgi:hypothetical protein